MSNVERLYCQLAIMLALSRKPNYSNTGKPIKTTGNRPSHRLVRP